jgi:ribosomal protein S17E
MVKNKDSNSENNLPKELIDRYKNWKSNTFDKNKTLYEDLSLNGQKPSSYDYFML